VTSHENSYLDYLEIRSGKLRELKLFAKSWQAICEDLPQIEKFRLVVDTNVILADIRWMVVGRRSKEATPSLIETIVADTIDVYAPLRLFEEMDEKLIEIAAEQNLDLEAMRLEWSSYKPYLKAAEPEWELIADPAYRVDPDDAEFAALEKSIGADGVISKDDHLRRMGAKVISPQCIIHLRDYSRSAAIELNIRIHGLGAMSITVAAFQAATAGVAAVVKTVRSAPDWVKLGLLVGALIVALNPAARARLTRTLSGTLKFVSEATPTVVDLIASASALASQHKGEAERHLALAMRELS